LSESPSLGYGAAVLRLLRRLFDHPAFILPRDFRLFLVGARTDAAIRRTRAEAGARAAFESAYTGSSDPWASATPRFRYQQRKYEQIMAMLPDRRFRSTLDLGCGLGLLSQHLAGRSDAVLGVDVADAALDHARGRAAGIDNLTFAQGDLLDLPAEMNGRFDLIVVADTLYYLSPLGDELLKSICARISALLMPGGICLLANHFFFSADPDSRLSRRIHDAFRWSPHFGVVSQHRHAFFIATLLSGRTAMAVP
jgi:SAM-dependent methyltransferase